MECPTCRSPDVRDDIRPIGPHYGKRVCPNGHHCGWIPRPAADMSTMPAELKPFLVTRAYPVSLAGTPGQVAAARSIRLSMLKANADGEFNLMLRNVNDATWFLANKDRTPPGLKCWPRVDQMEANDL